MDTCGHDPEQVAINRLKPSVYRRTRLHFAARSLLSRRLSVEKRRGSNAMTAAERRPRVSIGLPVYNGEEFLKEAIVSILDQTFEDFELLISDNASTDGTLALCESFAARDSRIKVLRSSVNHGATWNFDRVFAAAKGRLFKWQACDDVLNPSFLEQTVEALVQNPAAVLAYTLVYQIDRSGQETPPDTYIAKAEVSTRLGLNRPTPHERFRVFVDQSALWLPVFGLIRTDVLAQTGLMGRYVGSDRVLLAELTLHGPFVEVPQHLFGFRQHTERYGKKYKTSRERIHWVDPSKATRLAFPEWRLLREYAQAASRAPIARPEKARCMVELARFPLRRWRQLGGEVASAVSSLARRESPKRPLTP